VRVRMGEGTAVERRAARSASRTHPGGPAPRRGCGGGTTARDGGENGGENGGESVEDIQVRDPATEPGRTGAGPTGDPSAPMRRALQLAAEARPVAPPWPWVGCVLVRDGQVVGEGRTGPYPGGPHAEVAALTAAGPAARGATAYVTLEPCDHHGNTPPCTDALLAAGVAEVVVAQGDPDPRVAGRGLARLRAAGVAVRVGDGADAAAAMLAPYLHQRRTGRAYVVAKWASSLDGRVAGADGSARWITGPAARADAHRLRAASQAVVVGSGTVLADRPSLTVRDAPSPPRPPWRVVLDGRGRVPATGPLFDPELAPTLVCTTGAAPPERVAEWRRRGAQVEVVPAGPGGGVDLAEVLSRLAGRYGVVQAMVEGGPGVHAGLVRAGLVDRFVVYVAGALLGRDARPALDLAVPGLESAPRLVVVEAAVCGGDARLVLEPAPAAEPDGRP